MSDFFAAWFPRVRRPALAIVLVASTALLVVSVHDHYPIQDWLFWRLLGYWASLAMLVTSWLSLGNLIVGRCMKRSLPELSHWAVSFAIGMFGFELLMFLAGLLQLFHRRLFFALPLACIAVGAGPLWQRVRRVFRHVVAARRRTQMRPAFQLALIAFGLFQLGLIYFAILTPDNAQFDARWKHLAIAEDFVAQGGLRRFSEGWFFSTRVHFTSYLYTWAFLAPKARLFDQIVLSSHIEFIVFAWTAFVGIPALVRRLVPSADPRLTWIVRFLFPGVMVYDSTLSAGADHVGAMYCVPIYLLTARFFKDLNPRVGALLGATLAGVTLVKESLSVMLVPVPIAVIGGRWLWLVYRQIRDRAATPETKHWLWQGPLSVTLSGLLGTAPFWLKNWIWHGNPLYPQGAKYFSPHPWTPDASYIYDWGYRDYQFTDPGKLRDLFKVLPTFAFDPHEFGKFHGDVPTFGFLFTLLIPCLLFLRGTRRIWAVVGGVHVAMVVWWFVHHYDRYLQGVMPLMAATTAATIVLIYRQGGQLARGALALLIGAQVVWGGDQYFYQTHAMVKSPAKRVLDLLDAGYRKNYEERFDTQNSWVAIGRSVPKNALLLRHESHDHLGVGVRTLEDWMTYQYAISYGLLGSAAEVHALLKSLGVTHLQWFTRSSRSWDSLAGDIRFFDFAINHTTDAKQVGRSTVATLPAAPPTREIGSKVLLLGCGRRSFASGIYELADLRVPSFGPESKRFPRPRTPVTTGSAAAAVDESIGAIVVEPKCGSLPTSADGFVQAAVRRGIPRLTNPPYQIYVRNLGASSPATGSPVRSRGRTIEPDSVDAPGDEPSNAP